MTPGDCLPREGGVYVLRLALDEPADVMAGALGSRRLPRGSYAYVGSAHGPGGLAARLGRHLSGAGRRRWHVDHLRAVARPVSGWFAAVPADREHGWAGLLATALGGRHAWPGFGASDCRCESHLLHFSRAPAFDEFRRAAAGAWPVDPPAVEVPATAARLPDEERRRLVIELDMRRELEGI